MSSTPAPTLPALVFQPFEGDIPQKVIEVIGYGADGQVQVRLERSRYAETRTHTRHLRVVTSHRIVDAKYQHTQGGVFYSEPRRVAYTCSCGTVRRGRSVASASSSFDSHVRREQAKAAKA